MKRSLLDILACPACRGCLSLVVDREEDDEVVSGRLDCAECGARYPIEDAIPNMLPLELRG